MPTLVIVGASLAGLRAAEAARRSGWDDELIVVGEEGHMPYTRPPLSKELLTTAAASVADHLLPAQVDATWLLDERATGIDRDARRLKLAGGEPLAYERLVIATGCRARRWSGPGAELAGLHLIRHAEDALALRSALEHGSRVAIVGAGFIGCEVASSARKLGLEVSLFDIASTPMPALGPLLGERCAALHRAHGVDLRLGVSIAALYGESGRVRGLELADGTRHEADVVVVALGALPCTDWLADSGLAVERGVRCDATLTVEGDPDLLAAGDIAEWPHPLAGRPADPRRALDERRRAGGASPAATRCSRLPSGRPSSGSRPSGPISTGSGSRRSACRTWQIATTSSRRRTTAPGSSRSPSATECWSASSRSTARDASPTTAVRLGGPLDLEALRAELAEDPQALGTASAGRRDRKETVSSLATSLDAIDLSDPDLYVPSVPYEIFALLRREDPVHFNPERTGPGFWAVTRYEDIRTIHRDPATFSSEVGGITLEDLAPEHVEARKTMIDMDPPRHDELRGMVNRRFTPNAVTVWEDLVRNVVTEVLDEALPLGGVRLRGAHLVRDPHAGLRRHHGHPPGGAARDHPAGEPARRPAGPRVRGRAGGGGPDAPVLEPRRARDVRDRAPTRRRHAATTHATTSSRSSSSSS